jgi:D-alanine-D-alanine ligase
MDTHPVHIGIAYNAFVPTEGRTNETVSESSVAFAARDVMNALNTNCYTAALIALRQSLPAFLKRLNQADIDVLVNLCEGYRGRPQWESHIAGFLEMEQIAFTGNSARTLALCQDKFRTKAVLKAFGLPTASCTLVSEPDQAIDMEFPLIVKPNNEDASLGIYPSSVVTDSKSLYLQVRNILQKYRQPVLVEAFIEGREFNVAVFEDGETVALPVSEIDFSTIPEDQPRICGYESKWFEDHVLYQTTKPVCPAPLSDEETTLLQKTAIAAFKATGCRDYARVDFRMDAMGDIFILEVNPNPDISLNAGFARALAAAGILYPEFWNRLITRTLDRKDFE